MPTLNAAFDSLYRSHVRQLTAFARRRVGALEAEDIVHEAYVRALHEESVTTIPSQRAFLFRVVTNLTVDAARRTLVRSRYANERLMNSQ
ncbi:MAG TPA: sigma factor, partial [Methylocystis sp.]